MRLCRVGYKETNCQAVWRFLHPNPLGIQGDLVSSAARELQHPSGALRCPKLPVPSLSPRLVPSIRRCAQGFLRHRACPVPAQQGPTPTGNARDRCTAEPKSPAPAEQEQPLQHLCNARGIKQQPPPPSPARSPPPPPPGSCTMMDGVKWSAGEGKHAQRLDSGELPPAGTQWANKPRPAGRAGSPISCPIKKQIEQPASYSPPQ